jgi:valyl-tRNA synthetase
MKEEKEEIMPKAYEPASAESKWYREWKERGYFRADAKSKAPPFTIVIPPPNVTGTLHIGHALNNTIQDIIIRYKRMDGFNALWLPGTDHAGIATQNVVERLLKAEGIERWTIGREKFLERVWKWKDESHKRIREQLERLAVSCDWSRERFTLDEGLSRAVRLAFVTLYQNELIYRDNYIINWCPRCGTALSDLEVEQEEVPGKLYYIHYPMKGSNEGIVVATTRPETMLGDTAVAVHPDDERYKKLIGKILVLPLINREIPLIADSSVKSDFGTGAVKITPAHDFADFELSKRHNLPAIKVIDDSGKMTENAGAYSGLDRFVAREKVLDDLKRENLLKKVEDYKIILGHCYRCKTVVEPLLSLQWFVRTKPLAEPAIKAVESGRIRLIPEMWNTSYFSWMKNIRDWCISRQIWWGHRIPAWYCKDCGGITVSVDTPQVCSKCKSVKIEQDSDVLDTWFSSALWPFSTLGWPDNTEDLKVFYPTSVLVTSFDILFFWVARMIMMGLYFMKEVPFRGVYLHALVRDLKGQKMSKSKGNVIDPLIMIDRYGVDAFRFTLTALTAQGREIKLSEKNIEGYRHFINKLWNAARFILTNTDHNDAVGYSQIYPQSILGRWIYHKYQETVKVVRKEIDDYNFDSVARTIYKFLWNDLCDWYLESVKPFLQSKEKKSEEHRKMMLYLLDGVLRLLHPIIPVVTEEIWHKIPGKKEMLMKSNYPLGSKIRFDEEYQQFEFIKDFITLIRNIRSVHRIPPQEKFNVHVRAELESRREVIEKFIPQIIFLSRIKSLTVSREKHKFNSPLCIKYEGMEIFLDISGLIDFEKEAERVETEVNKVKKEIELLVKKLNDENFRNNAPEEIVKEKEDELKSLKEKERNLSESLERLRAS